MSSFVISQLGSDYFFKVPEIVQEQIIHKNIHNILLCDSSGSMGSYWAKVAQGWNNLVDKLDGSVSLILFSDNAFRYAGKTLPPHMPQSGGTNIIAGLTELEKEIKKFKSYDLIRVYFVTDGEDSNGATFQSRFDTTMSKYYKPTNNVEFYVLGLTGNFPVFISQSIRAKVHTGRATIPNLFWSQNCSETEINVEFANIGKLNKSISKIQLPVNGLSNPFGTPSNTFYTGDWVLIPKSQNEVPNWFECDGNVYQLDINSNPTFDNLLELFAQWVGILQTTSIKLGSDTNTIKIYAEKTKAKMEQMYQDYISSIHILNGMKTFTERVANKQIKTKTYQYQAYLKIAGDLASGIRLQFMDNVELAKQLKGVYVGKYSQKAFELRSHTDEDFEADKLAFIKILENTLPLLKDIESKEHCVITLDNTLDIIRSEGFVETLINTTSKIDFLQNIGVTGNGVLLNITDASTINPWVTQIKDVSKHCAILSTTAVEDLIDNPPPNANLTQYEKDSCVVAIQTGNGDMEKINCVIPLFEKKVADAMGPIIRSRLFQLICTYSIQKSPFTLNHNAHLGALSGLLGHLLTQPKSEWREQTVNKIRHTASVYLCREGLQKFIEKLWSNPARAVVTEIPDEEIKCESITKLLLMILVSAKDKSQEQIAEVMCHVWKEYIGRIIGNKNQPAEWFDLANPELLSDQMEWPDFDSVYEHGYTVMETKKAIEKKLRTLKFDHPDGLKVNLDIGKLKQQFNGGSVGNLSWKGLKVFTNSIGYDLTEENIFQYVTHSLRHSGSADRMSPVDSYSDSKEWVCNELIGLRVSKIREEVINNYKTKASERYFESFGFEHQTILPMSKQAIILEAIGLGIDVSEETFDSVYTFNPDNKLLANACMGKDCPYYLHPRGDFSAHIERMKANPDFIHSFHRTVYMCKNKPINKIIEDLEYGKCRPGKYQDVPLTISKKILVEKYSGDVEINKDIYQSIYDN
jgi:hypothetical protein